MWEFLTPKGLTPPKDTHIRKTINTHVISSVQGVCLFSGVKMNRRSFSAHLHATTRFLYFPKVINCIAVLSELKQSKSCVHWKRALCYSGTGPQTTGSSRPSSGSTPSVLSLLPRQTFFRLVPFLSFRITSTIYFPPARFWIFKHFS